MTIQIPQLRGMDEVHRKAIVSAFQSAQQDLDAVKKSVTPAAGVSTQQVAALTQKVALLAAALTALTNTVNNLPAAGSSGIQRTFGFFSG